MNIEDLEVLENATVRGNLTITGGTLESELLMLNIQVEEDLNLEGYEGDVNYTDVEVGGETIQ